MALNLLLLLVGLALLLGGGDLLVQEASALARGFGVFPLVVGLTVVAFGTSAPELSVNLFVAFQGNTEISFANIIGSNIFNLLFVNGLCATFRPIPIPPPGGGQNLFMMVFLSLLLLPLCVTDKKKIV